MNTKPNNGKNLGTQSISNLVTSSKNAFTLAEVLITLGVIGVVAAMTLPTLIHNYQVKQWETGLKRSYNILTNGFKKVMTDAGCMDLECTGIFVPNETNTQNTENPDFNERMELAAQKAFNAIKVCKYGSTDDECNKEYTIKYLKGDGKYSGNKSQEFSMNLADGTIVYVQNWGCFKTPLKNRQSCGWITVDVNGDKGPNTYGKDVWGLGRLYSDGRLIPNTSLDWAGTKSEDPHNYYDYWRNKPWLCGHAGVKLKDDTQSEIYGLDCAARVMENNWEIDYLK